MCLEI
jgi:hypothetical protein